MIARLDELLGRRVSMRALAVLRILAGLVGLRHLQPFLADAADGRSYLDAFHHPYASWYPQLAEPAYHGLLVVGAVAAAAMTLGLATRVATVVTFAVVTYNVFVSTTHFHNNRAYLMVVLGVLAVAPSGRELSLDAWFRRQRGLAPLPTAAPAWPLWLLRFEASVVYGASGFSKLVDPDWFGGTVTWLRVVRHEADLEASPLPGWVVQFLLDRSFHTGAAKVIVLTELFIALGLWFRPTRYGAVWVAVAFHVAIELSASVQVFGVLAVSMLVVWAVPSTRDRTVVIDPAVGWQRALARVVAGLDWLARFRVERAPGPLTVTDRDGSVRTGGAAAVFVLSRLPLTAWFALPFLLAPGCRAVPPGPAYAPASSTSGP